MPGTLNINPVSITALNGGVVFIGITASDGDELWFSDGTAAGTKEIRDINPAPATPASVLRAGDRRIPVLLGARRDARH